MFVKRDHVRILEALLQGKEAKDSGVDQAQLSKRILELKIQGLIDESGVTAAGKKLVEAFKGKELDRLEEPLVNSEILKICELYISTGIVPDRWKAALNARGIGEKEASVILEAYRLATPSVLITPQIAELILSMPPGPAPLSDLTNFMKRRGLGINVLNALEAMRWIKISPDTKGRVYTLTNRGRRAREILQRVSFGPYVLVTEAVAKLVEKGSETNETLLMDLVAGGEATALGKGMLEIFYAPEVLNRVAPTYVTVEEIKVLSAIEKVKKKQEKNPEILPTEERLEKESKVKGIGEVLAILESKGWIKRVEVKGKDTYQLTEDGKAILQGFGNIIMDVTSDAVKAVTFSIAGDVPIMEWVQLAQKAGLVAGDITKRGKLLYNVARRMLRIPILVGYDAAVLARVPRGKAIPLAQLVREVAEYIRTERPDIRMPRTSPERRAQIAISEAESRGYVVVLQNGAVVLTKVGSLMKEVIEYGKTREIVNTVLAITPTTYYLLKTLKEHEAELKAVWREEETKKYYEALKVAYNSIKKFTSVTIEEVEKQLKILKRLGLLGDMGVTKAGQSLVAAGSALEEEAKAWRS